MKALSRRLSRLETTESVKPSGKTYWFPNETGDEWVLRHRVQFGEISIDDVSPQAKARILEVQAWLGIV